MTRSQLDLHRFEKVLALLDSAVEGEALAALGRAKHLLAGAGISFGELKVGISSFQGGAQNMNKGETVETAQIQKLEAELESLRWSLARHELQIASLRQSVEEKAVLIKNEQTRRHSYEGELAGLRKAHAVQMEEALNRKEEVQKLERQLEAYKALKKVIFEKKAAAEKAQRARAKSKSATNHAGIEKSGIEKSGGETHASTTECAPVVGRAPVAESTPAVEKTKKVSARPVASKKSPSLVVKSGTKTEEIMLQQGALNLIGGEDKSVGQEYRWARVEDKYQMVVEDDARVDIGNDVGKNVPAQGPDMKIQAEA
ncbi:hypothetical protein [Kiloniella antarctica]|uniref:HPt domain-containing protein n=1 Tax=Kiloniella antarctica TaxID=1550907 RepID=A0ABW5BMC9_9PROT